MAKRMGWCGLAAVLLTHQLTVQAQTVSPGLWEFKTSMKVPGMPDMEAQLAQMRKQLDQLPPETRKAVEQQMASLGMSFGPQGAMRVCFGPEQARQPIREGQREGNCTYTQVSHSGKTWRGQMRCTDPASEGRFTTTLHSAQHFSTQAVLKGAQGEMQMTSEARRVSADCGALKPLGKP